MTNLAGSFLKKLNLQNTEINRVFDNETYLKIESSQIPEISSKLYKDLAFKLRGIFATDTRKANKCFNVYHIFSQIGFDNFVILQTEINEKEPSFPSIVTQVPSANWHEREIKDMFGLDPIGHTDKRPLLVHEDWPKQNHPLRKDYDFSKKPKRINGDYPFQLVEGDGVYEIPVGPVHAGIIEPGHFRFSAVGETIVNLEIRHFWTHKGTEKIFEQSTLNRGVGVSERVSGDATIAHSLAYCQAVERLANIHVSKRAALLRVIFSELERMYFHLGDIGGITVDVAFSFGFAQASRLKEQIMSLNERLTGNRLLRAVNIVGGVTSDFDDNKLKDLAQTTESVAKEVREISEIILNTPSVIDRLETTGKVTSKLANDLSLVGVVARSAGINEDCRRDNPYAAYRDLNFNIPVYKYGDVMARLRVRIDEVEQSYKIISQAIQQLPNEQISTKFSNIPQSKCALGYSESGRGLVLYWVMSGENNKIERCKVISPSFINWPAIQYAVLGNIVPDFPLINKSFNLSYSGCDR